MIISIKGFITSKEAELFYDCADRYARNKKLHKFAISDGVSKSFFPKIWADVLVNNWVSEKWNTDKEFIDQSQKDWLQQVTEIANKPDAKWFTKNAFNRKEAGLATFVGLRFYEKKKKKKKKKDWFWRAEALGDSFLFFVPKKIKDFSKECVVLSSKPKNNIVFDNFPDYLSSIGDKHKGHPGQKIEHTILEEGTFYLMTDALAEWFLKEKEDAINNIDDWKNQKDFEGFVGKERSIKKLGNDDSAILIIEVKDDKKDELAYVEQYYSDINELVKAQQKEVEEEEIAKEQELILHQENTNAEISTEQTQQAKPVESKLSEEVEPEIEKPKKGMLEKGFEKGKELLFGKKEKEQSDEQKETDEKVEISEKHLKEKEPSTQGEENKTEIEKFEDSEKNESKEIEPKSKEEPESNAKIPKKRSQNITDKF